MITQPRELFSENTVNSKITQIAINILYQNMGIQEFNLLTNLKGGRYFADALNKKLLMVSNKLKLNNYSIQIKSYIGTESSGKIEVIKDLEEDIIEKEVIIIEDIIDTGRSIDFLINYLSNNKKAKNIQLASLVSKPERRLPKYKDIKIDYLGFEVPDKFIVGCGMDYNEKFRELPYLGILDG